MSDWTVDTLRIHMQAQLDAERDRVEARLRDLIRMLDERYATQTKALDAAFQAQQTAMEAAALAQEKAVARAETSADKRFESVNEFRQQLADQARTFMPRIEAEAAIGRNSERLQEQSILVQSFITREEVAADNARSAERFQELADRVNTRDGRSGGFSSSWGIIVSLIGLLGVIIAIYVALRPH